MSREPAGGEAALAVDAGGTKIAAGLVDRRGRVHALRTAPTGPPGAESLRRAAELGAAAAGEAAGLGFRTAGAGIGLPELVEDGRITSAAVVGWEDDDVRAAFARYGPVRVEADVRAAALAESRLAGSGLPSVSLYINLGTGVSHCLLLDGRPFEGQHGRALMCGSALLTVLDEGANRLVGCRLEDVASGRGISERYRSFTGEEVSAAEVFRRAGGGDPGARLAAGQAMDLLGRMTATLIDILDPGCVIIGGGLTNAPNLVEQVGATARAAVWSDRARQTPITAGRAGRRAGVIGAGLALLDRTAPS